MNPFSQALEGVLTLERAGKLKGPTRDYVINQARYYARRNKLPFDGSLSGALHLAEHADRVCRDYAAERQRLQVAAEIERERRRRVIVVSKG